MLKFKIISALIICILIILNLNSCNLSLNALSYKIDEKTRTLYLYGTGELDGKKVSDVCKDEGFTPEKIVIDSGITSIPAKVFTAYEEGENESIEYDRPTHFRYISEVVLPDTVKTIGVSAFENCEKLKKINLPKGIKYINSRAFYNCEKLDNVTIPGSLQYIGESAFKNCKLTNLTIQNGVKKLAGAFIGCELKSLKLPDSVIQIDSAFAFSGLREIILPKHLTAIGNETFYGCYELSKITLSDSITSIGVEAFSSCEKLKQISLPEKIEKIGEEAFIGTKLKTITIPKNVKVIGEKAFGYDNYCKKMKNITIKGYKGSAAEKYAKKNNFKFVEL